MLVFNHPFSGKVQQEIIKHSEEAAKDRHEACGIVVSGEYIRCENIADNPKTHFEIDVHEYAYAMEDGTLEGVVHSHCYHGEEVHYDPTLGPSKADMAGQIEMALPWAVCTVYNGRARSLVWWGDELPIPDLLQRPFIQGVTDCYGCLRDDLRLRGYDVPNVPRDPYWWEQAGANLIMENFAKCGFQKVNKEDMQPGDGFVAQIDCKAINHCGVILNDGLIMHHLFGKLSARRPIGPWYDYIAYGMRFKGDANS